MSVTRVSNNNVEVSIGDLKAICDPKFGGTPLSIKFKGQELLDTFPGAAANCTYETGQDPTQGGANGFIPFQLTLTTGQYNSQVYYGRETLLSPTAYKLNAFIPMFWGSHEASDDAIPTECYGNWSTKYNNILKLPLDAYTGLSQIYFVPSQSKKSGMFFVGNEMLDVATVPWSKRLCSIPNGNVACKTNFNFIKASSDAFAGIVFRKDIKPNATEAEAFAAPGFHFYLNRLGNWALHVMPANNIIASGKLPNGLISKLKTTGVVLEVRTNTTNPGILELLCDDIKLKQFDHAPVLLGKHFGYYAYSSSGNMRIDTRQVFDVNLALTMTATPLPHSIQLELEINKSAAVQGLLPLYRAGLGGFFFNVPYLNDAHLYLVRGGVVITGPDPQIVDLQVNDTIRLVSQAHSLNFDIKLTEMKVNNTNASAPHALLAKLAGGVQSIAHINTLPVTANTTPVGVEQSKLTYELSVYNF